MPTGNITPIKMSSWITTKFIIAAIFVALTLVAGFTSYYVVDQKELAAVLLFGRFNRLTEPGLHFKLPFGIEQNYNVPTRVVLKDEFGFRTDLPGVTTEPEYFKYLYDKKGKQSLRNL